MDMPKLTARQQQILELIQSAIGHGHTDCDFAVLLHEEAAAAGLDLKPENVEVSDGLSGTAS